MAFTTGNLPYDGLGGGALQGSENSVLLLREMPDVSIPWEESRPSYVKFLGGTGVYSNIYKARLALAGGWEISDVQGLTYQDLGEGWCSVDGLRYYCLDNDFAIGWQRISGRTYYFDVHNYAMKTGLNAIDGFTYFFNSDGVMQKGWVTIGGLPYEFDNNGRWIVTHTHNVPWAGQPNNYYCGPTAGYLILLSVGAGNSKYNGRPLTINNVANHMETDRYGYTSFDNRKFQQGLNRWLGRNIYSTIELPTSSIVRREVLDSFKNGYPVAFDAHERRGGPHYNGHNNSTFSHIVVVSSYNQQSDDIYLVDPGAEVIWSRASRRFWYDLKTFVNQYVHAPDNGYRDGIGMYYANV